MKFVILVVAFCVVGVFADSSEIEEGNDDMSEKAVISRINGVLLRFYETARSKEEKISAAVAKFADIKCMYSKYKENNLLQWTSGKYFENNQIRNNDASFVFVGILLQCSPKINPIAEFVFENVYTFNTLYKAFIDEPALKGYTSYIACANKYAINKHYLNETFYGFKVKVAGDNDFDCDEAYEFLKAFASTIKLKSRYGFGNNCYIRLITHVERVIFRLFLDIQFDLSFDQRKQEREFFVAEVQKLFQDSTTCAAQPKSKANKLFYQALQF